MVGQVHSYVLTLAAGCLLMTAACVGSDAVVCLDGRTCPAGSVCDEAGDRCLAPEQLTACAGVVDGQACRYQGIDAICIGGVCVPAHCGDNIVTGTEECDGNALGELDDCKDLGFYDSAPLACSAECRYDRAVCASSGLCGDAVRNGPRYATAPISSTRTAPRSASTKRGRSPATTRATTTRANVAARAATES